MKDSTLYRKVFCDISRGYSKIKIDDEPAFIRHLTTHDQVDLEDIEETFFKKAKKKGLQEEKEVLEQLALDDVWTKEDEKFIDRQTIYIQNLHESKSQFILKSQIDQQNSIIEEEQKKLSEKIQEKDALLGSTCEKYAKQRINDHYILKSFCKDGDVETPLYLEKELDDLAYSEIAKLIKAHNDHFNVFSEENIQKTILQDFYYPYMPFGEDTMQFFGKPACNLENNDNIPEKIRKDPKALLDFASTSTKGKDELEKHAEKGGASTIVGASKEDYEYMGVEEGGVSMHKAAKEKGGSLNMQDLIDMTGS